ncbi:hypothetical protein BGZ73_008210 [Actinomortierella ambigua]|nr:hypothetical protein BGZ73_008210 [Actinomortierella ambigua]
MTDYWRQFHLWHREESPLVDTEYDLDREHQRAMHQQQQQQQEQQQNQQQQQLPCRPIAHYHHHHHYHHPHAATSPAAKRQHTSTQGMPALARTSSTHSMAPSPSSPRRRTSSQLPRISVAAASPVQSRELPRSTHDLNRLLESVFDDATAHAPMSHSRSHTHRDKDSASEDDDEEEDDGPLCMRTPSTRHAASHGPTLSLASPVNRVRSVHKTAPLSPKEKTLSHPPKLPLSSLPQSSLSVRPSHTSAASRAQLAPPAPAPAPAPKVTSKPKFFVSDDSEDEYDGDSSASEEDNEEDLLVANYRKLSHEIAQGHRHQQHRMPSPHMDKGGHEGDDEREEDDIVADTTLALGPSKKHTHNHHLNPNSHPLVAERRQSLLSDLLMAEKMANLAAKNSADSPLSTNECSMANTSPIPARVATFKQTSAINHGSQYLQSHHPGARTDTAPYSSQSSRCPSAANSDGESQLYPTILTNGAAQGCHKEMTMVHRATEQQQHLHRISSHEDGLPVRSPLMRTRKSLFKKLDELVKATEAEEAERKAQETEMTHQRMALMKDALEEPEDYFGPGAATRLGIRHQGSEEVIITTSAKQAEAPISTPLPLEHPKQQPQPRSGLMKVTTLLIAALSAAVALAAPMEKRGVIDNEKAVIGYFEPLSGFPIDKLDFKKYTHINYAFGYMWKGAPNPYTVYVDYAVEGPKIKELVRRGKANGVKIIFSVGGWWGSQTFSEVAADPVLRKAWIESVMVFLRPNTLGPDAPVPNGWDMDGFDIDWEFPGVPGASCNTFAPNDTANYLLLLQETRAQMDLEFPDNHKTITSAVGIFPWAGADGTPLTDARPFLPVFDWLNVMMYDVHGPWSETTGPNAPLFGRGPTGAEEPSASQAIDTWTKAGWPKNRIAMGTPFYGRALTAKVNMNTQNPITQYVPQTNVAPKGGPLDSNATFPLCVETPQFWGFWNWHEIREHILTNDQDLNQPVAGWTRYWDNVTKTPWLFRESDSMFISYDDLTSMSAKVDFARYHGLKGLFMWESQMDYKTELLDVLNQIHCSSSACICRDIPKWDAAKVYAQPGTKVTYNGHLWTNKWWSRGDAPQGTEWGAWKDDGIC